MRRRRAWSTSFADAFARLVTQQRPGLAEIDPRVIDVAWLAGE